MLVLSFPFQVSTEALHSIGLNPMGLLAESSPNVVPPAIHRDLFLVLCA